MRGHRGLLSCASNRTGEPVARPVRPTKDTLNTLARKSVCFDNGTRASPAPAASPLLKIAGHNLERPRQQRIRCLGGDAVFYAHQPHTKRMA
jgi:hypothetical protein